MEFCEEHIKKVRESLAKSGDDMKRVMEEKGRSNPFIEHWGKGRPSLEKLIRRDFRSLWYQDNKQLGFLGALISPSITPITKGHPVRIKFIQRGSC